MFKKLFAKPIEAAKDKVSDYVNLKMEEVKLTTIEKASPIAASIILIVICLVLALLTFVFLGMALASWLTQLLDSSIYGYLLTAGIFILLLIIFGFSFKGMVRFIGTKIGKAISDHI